MANRKPDFTGWATKTGIKCTDGRTIMENAFADQDGQSVPLMWQHFHDDPAMVLGHAVLHNKKGGVWAECYFNKGEKAKEARNALENKDIKSLSIYANQLKQTGGNVIHGVIRELSMVIAGANNGATIDNVVLAHGDSMTELEDEALIYSDESEQLLFLEHADEDPEKKEEAEPVAEEKKVLEHADEGEKKADERTVKDVWDSMTEEQQQVCYYMIGQALEGGKGDDDDTAEHSDEDGEVMTMKTNVFDKETKQETYLSHADQMKIIERAKKLGSMKEAWDEALETNDTLAHAVYNDDGTEQTYGIANIDYLFPEYKTLNETPDKIRQDDDWVNVVMGGVRKTPFARIKTVHANITMDEARAKGYIKGNEKKEEVFNLLKRTVDPQTVYKKQKFDRDDVIDITDFDVIAWTKAEMRDKLNEEIARAILIGDGRDVEAEDKIKPDHIKPILTDDDLYAVKVTADEGSVEDETARNIIRAIIKSRNKYKGSGNLIFFTSEDWLSEMLLVEDQIGHRLYKTINELATALRVNRIVTVPQFEGLKLIGNDVVGIAVDLKDYATGTNRRGQVEMFDDFDIDFNQYKYLIETRLSGMLTKPYSALIITVGKMDIVYKVGTPESNPKSEGFFEKEGTVYRKTADTAVVSGKTYYTRSTEEKPR